MPEENRADLSRRAFAGRLQLVQESLVHSRALAVRTERSCGSLHCTHRIIQRDQVECQERPSLLDLLGEGFRIRA